MIFLTWKRKKTFWTNNNFFFFFNCSNWKKLWTKLVKTSDEFFIWHFLTFNHVLFLHYRNRRNDNAGDKPLLDSWIHRFKHLLIGICLRHNEFFGQIVDWIWSFFHPAFHTGVQISKWNLLRWSYFVYMWGRRNSTYFGGCVPFLCECWC